MVSTGGRNTSLRSGGCVVIVSSREEGPGSPAAIRQTSAVYGAACARLVHLGGGSRSRGIPYLSKQLGARLQTYRRGEAVGFVPALDRLTVRQISDRYLSEEERIDIADLRRAALTIRQIAAELDRAPSTVSRELRRNSRRDGQYRPFEAHRWAVQRRARRHRRRIDKNPALCELIAELPRNGGARNRSPGTCDANTPRTCRCGCATKASIRLSTNHIHP